MFTPLSISMYALCTLKLIVRIDRACVEKTHTLNGPSSITLYYLSRPATENSKIYCRV